METITVYRSGGLTPYDEIRNTAAERLDLAAESSTGKNPNRCSSVYATVSLDEAETTWSEYRRYDQKLDGTIYKIVIPAKFMNEDIYAYDLDVYHAYCLSTWIEDENTAVVDSTHSEKIAKDYMNSRLHISDWENGLLHMSESDLQCYEVLIPHHIATQCEWSVLTDADRDEWEPHTESYSDMLV